jgi:hypothetical protein
MRSPGEKEKKKCEEGKEERERYDDDERSKFPSVVQIDRYQSTAGGSMAPAAIYLS